MVVSLSRGNSGDSAAFKPVIQNLSTNKCRMKGSGCLILQFEEKACLGGCGCRDRLCGGESIENESGERQLLGQRGRGVFEECRKEVRPQRGFPCSSLATVGLLALNIRMGWYYGSGRRWSIFKMHLRPGPPERIEDNVQIYSSLVLLSGAQSCPNPAGELLHGAHC